MTRLKTLFTATFVCLAVWSCLFSAPVPVAQAAGPADGAGGQAGWTAHIAADNAGPNRFVAVEKASQSFFVFEQHSPLRVVQQSGCSTGQAPGDKLKRGDLKTPEGVYFITSKLTQGLDYGLYGDRAYTLNYPNPVDVLTGKTGSGIWIHGRGQDFSPNETKGCVVLGKSDLSEADARLKNGTPVVIAFELRVGDLDPKDNPEAVEVIELTKKWAQTWSRKSDEFFALHDDVKFALSQGAPFSKFRDHKKELFTRLPWIDVKTEDIRAVKGPGYWVTYFGQLYRSPEHVSEGMKRLYWMRDQKGQLRIVGMEMEESNLGLLAKYGREPSVADLKPAPAGGRTVAAVTPPAQAQPQAKVEIDKPNRAAVNAEVETFVERWRTAWEKGSLHAYLDCYAQNAEQSGKKGKALIREHKLAVWTAKPPSRVKLGKLDIKQAGSTVEVRFNQDYQSADGSRDKGRKTLLLERSGDSWRIREENWSGS